MAGSLGHLGQKVVERQAKDEDLQNLARLVVADIQDSEKTYRVHVAHIASVHKPTWLQERYLYRRFNAGIHVVEHIGQSLASPDSGANG